MKQKINQGIRERYLSLNISTKGEKTKIRFLIKDLIISY